MAKTHIFTKQSISKKGYEVLSLRLRELRISEVEESDRLVLKYVDNTTINLSYDDAHSSARIYIETDRKSIPEDIYRFLMENNFRELHKRKDRKVFE